MKEKLTTPTSEIPAIEAVAVPMQSGDDSAIAEALRFGAILRRRLLPTAAVFLVVTAGVAVLGLQQTKLYRTTSTLHVAEATPNVLKDVGDVYSLGSVNPYEFPRYMETQAKILRGREITSDVVVKLKLDEDLEFLGMKDGLPEDKVQDALASTDPVMVFQEKVSAEQVEESNLLRIICVDTDASRAALIVNTLADTYIEYNSAQREDATATAVTWLEAQVLDAEKALKDTEKRLLEFRENQVLMGASIEDAIAINASTIDDLNSAVTQLRLARLSKQARWEKVAAASEDDIETIPEIVADPVVQEIRKELMEIHRERADLEARYGAKHPAMTDLDQPEQDLLKLMEQEVGAIVAAERRGIEALELEERAVQASLSQEQERADRLSRLQIEYDHLEREIEQGAELLEMLQGRFQEARLAEQLSTNNISVIEYSPTPMRRYKPRLSFVGLVALVIGFILSLTTAMVMDRVDAKIRHQSQLEEEFGLRVLGIQPAVKANGTNGKNGKKKPPVELFAAGRPRSPFAECLRTIRTNLLFMTSQRDSKLILVTSCTSGEGKTTFACNLAQTLATSGQRTLLLDVDLRSPSIASVFGHDAHAGQLTSLLIGEIEIEDAVADTEIKNLDVLLCGAPPPNPAELLESRQFRDLLSELEEKYDRVILDTPPVLPVTDTKVLGQCVDVLLLVVRQRVSDRYALRHTLRQLRDVGAPILGCVFNGADLDRSRYGYGYTYGGDKAKK
jgi:polysaccharide biosynthesis transport protein